MSEIEDFDGSFSESMLQAASELAHRLVTTLATEREALAKRDLARLRATIDEKDKLVEMLAQLERSRGLLLTPEQLASLDEPTQVRLTDLQNELRAQLLRCQETNAVNGRMVQRARVAVDEVLATLTGEHRSSTYGASGNSDGHSGSRTIGRA